METRKTTHTPGPLGAVLEFLDAACDEDEAINHNRNIGQAIETLRAALPVHAAAPELLAVCGAIIAAGLIECNCGSECDGTCTFSEIVRAIAKAEGK